MFHNCSFHDQPTIFTPLLYSLLDFGPGHIKCPSDNPLAECPSDGFTVLPDCVRRTLGAKRLLDRCFIHPAHADFKNNNAITPIKVSSVQSIFMGILRRGFSLCRQAQTKTIHHPLYSMTRQHARSSIWMGAHPTLPSRRDRKKSA